MAFIFTCGTHTFTSLLAGYENVTAQCQNCGNFSAKVFKRWQWFTFCFVPIIPFSLKPYHDVGCHICNFYQDIKFRPDVQAQMDGQGGGQAQQQQQQQPPPGGQIPMQPYGYNNQGQNNNNNNNKPPAQYV